MYVCVCVTNFCHILCCRMYTICYKKEEDTIEQIYHKRAKLCVQSHNEDHSYGKKSEDNQLMQCTTPSHLIH
jgi:hypothetical protein